MLTEVLGTYRVARLQVLLPSCLGKIRTSGDLWLNESAESGFIRQRAAGDPMLLECDSLGRVLWMSERTGECLHNPANLVDILRRPAMPRTVPGAGTLRFWLVWEFRN